MFVPGPRLVCVETNPGPRRSTRLTEEKRWRIVHLHTELGLEPTPIAKRVGVHRNTVYAVINKYHETGSIKDRPGRGRKRKLSTEDEKKIIKKAKQGKDATEIAREYKREGIQINQQTVRRIINAHNLKWLPRHKVQVISEVNEGKRLEYSRAMSTHNWHKVLFSDEKTFYLGAMKTHAYQEAGNRREYPVIRHPPKLNVWGAAGAHMKTKLYYFNENMNRPLYRKVIQSRLQKKYITFSSDCPARLPQRYQYLQDNAQWHKGDITRGILEEFVDDRIIEHPAQSPDLNIMEDLWSYLDRKVKAANITTIPALKRKLTFEWNNMPWSYIRKSVKSMPHRLAQCVEREGKRTQY